MRNCQGLPTRLRTLGTQDPLQLCEGEGTQAIGRVVEGGDGKFAVS
jgi:hypothetical protein